MLDEKFQRRAKKAVHDWRWLEWRGWRTEEVEHDGGWLSLMNSLHSHLPNTLSRLVDNRLDAGRSIK